MQSLSNFWVKTTPEGIQFEIHNEKIGTGATTTALKTHLFSISLKSRQHPTHHEHNVLLQSSVEASKMAVHANQLLEQHGFSEGLVHRDVKPANTGVGESKEGYLADLDFFACLGCFIYREFSKN